MQVRLAPEGVKKKSSRSKSQPQEDDAGCDEAKGRDGKCNGGKPKGSAGLSARRSQRSWARKKSRWALLVTGQGKAGQLFSSLLL